jgi:hypothetical protein
MGGVIVVDAGRSRSTCLGRDAYIHDHCLGYHHDYLLFYQLSNSNLSTHRMLFSREKPLVKTMVPVSTLSFTKTLKILAALLSYLFYFIFLFNLFIYHIQFNFAIYRRGIDNLSFALGARVCCLCAGTANEVLCDSPTGLITLIS